MRQKLVTEGPPGRGQAGHRPPYLLLSPAPSLASFTTHSLVSDRWRQKVIIVLQFSSKQHSIDRLYVLCFQQSSMMTQLKNAGVCLDQIRHCNV